MEKQEALETTVTRLSSDIKVLQSSHENLKSNLKDNSYEWWQLSIDNWLYPNDKIYEEYIRKELEDLCPDKMERYKKSSRWEALYSKIENSVNNNTLFGSFRRAVFEHVFKNKISQAVNSENSEAEIISWKSSEE
ncbi:7392_t:CDS:2, partial [Racocetra fulgida]